MDPWEDTGKFLIYVGRARNSKTSELRCTVTTMDKCCMFTFLLLVYLVDSQYSYMCQKVDRTMDDNVKNLDLRLKFPSDVFSDVRSTNHYPCNVIFEKPILEIQCKEREISCPVSCSDAECLHQWSDWTACAMSSGTRIRNRYRDVACANVEPTCCLPSGISLIDTQECILDADTHQECLFEWSDWTNCATSDGSGIGYRYRQLSGLCTVAADWSGWSKCTSSEEWYRHRSLNCSSNHSACLLPSNGSSFEISKCTPDPEGSGKENIKQDEKCYSLTEIIFVAFGCFLMGVLLSALLFILYMKRAQQGCYSKHVKEVQGDSKQQSGTDFQFLTERVVVKKYDPETPKSADSKNEYKSDETQYQSLSTNQIDNDHQIYDELEVNESHSHHHGNQPTSGRLKQTGSDKQIDHMTNLQHRTEAVYEYSRDCDLGGHNYFILESESISRESKTSSLGRPETYSEVGDEVRDTTLGTQDEQSDAAHEYFVLEHVKNGHN